MSQTLYRKYRPKNFSEIIGQQHIVRTLSNAIEHNRIGHAYLFTGPRGTGKTSIARILAKTINCSALKKAVTCEKCDSCKLINEGKSLDIIEIDAASNTGVDNIRELRETVILPPTTLKYKVYIIDEVHMLSTGAFNALLKTLEEPPIHVIFILATTEIHKVPATIQSRCQRFDFARLPLENIIEKLSLIAKTEKIKIEKEALEMIAIAAEGGMRDAESLLEQIIALEDKNITTAEVEEILGTADKKNISDTAELIIKKNTTKAIKKINSLLNDGYDLGIFTKSLINYFRQVMLLKVNKELSQYFSYEATKEQVAKMEKLAGIADLSQLILTINLLLEAQGKISAFILPQLPLEMAIIQATQKFPSSIEHKTWNMEHEEKNDNAGTSLKPVPQILQNKSNPDNNISEINLDSKLKGTDLKSVPAESSSSPLGRGCLVFETGEGSTEKPEQSPVQESDLDFSTVKSNWNRLLTDIQPYNHSLKALLCNCQLVNVKGPEITIATPYEFYKDKLNEPSSRLTIEEVFGKILECKVRIKVVVDKNLLPKKEEVSDAPEEPHQQDSLLSSAMEIMGGKIVE